MKNNNLPKEYEFFCKLQKVEGCSYLKNPNCPKTCNLALDYELEYNIDLEFDDVLGNKFKRRLSNGKYKRSF